MCGAKAMLVMHRAREGRERIEEEDDGMLTC